MLRLLSGIERWDALFPHVRAVEPLARGRWRLTVTWCEVPLTLVAAQRVSGDGRLVEQRFAAGMGLRHVCRWELSAPSESSTVLRLDIEAAGGPAVMSRLVMRAVVPALVGDTMEMIALLAESDRKARQGIA